MFPVSPLFPCLCLSLSCFYARTLVFMVIISCSYTSLPASSLPVFSLIPWLFQPVSCLLLSDFLPLWLSVLLWLFSHVHTWLSSFCAYVVLSLPSFIVRLFAPWTCFYGKRVSFLLFTVLFLSILWRSPPLATIQISILATLGSVSGCYFINIPRWLQ